MRLSLLIGWVTITCVTCVCSGVMLKEDSILEDREDTNLMGQLSHKSKQTYVVYGHGRQKERDLPVCESAEEACNLAHLRFWLTPITERLCRCPKGVCQLNYSTMHDEDAQHVSNRGQFKFCESLNHLDQCENGHPGLEVHSIDRAHPQQPELVYHDVRSKLLCTCPWPNNWVANVTHDLDEEHHVTIYTCNQLHKCITGDQCGYTRADTLETYYICSCPQRHLCLFPWDQKPSKTQQLYYQGLTYTGTCQLTYPEPEYY